MRKFIFLIGFFFTSSLIFAQSQNKDVKTVRKDIDKITNEIQILEKKIQEEEKREKLTERSINNIGQEIYLRQVMIGRLTKAENQLEKSTSYTKNEIENREKEVQFLRNVFKKRIIHLYKFGRINEIEALFLSNSFSQALVRLKYFMIFANIDKNNIRKIRENVNELKVKNDGLLEELETQKEIINKKGNEKGILARRYDVLKKEKDKIKSNREAYIAELKKKEASQKKLLELFTALSKSKPKIPFVIPSTSISFASLKGNMEWPAKGIISSRFGMNYNSELKTWKNNLGIDISAERGSEVYCVSYGRVYDSLWLPGFGPILIIEHDNGYITSYAHLMEILVELGDIVYQGQVIARVGDVGSFEGPKLNFQIWKDGKNLSPEVWLKRKTISAVIK